MSGKLEPWQHACSAPWRLLLSVCLVHGSLSEYWFLQCTTGFSRAIWNGHLRGNRYLWCKSLQSLGQWLTIKALWCAYHRCYPADPFPLETPRYLSPSRQCQLKLARNVFPGCGTPASSSIVGATDTAYGQPALPSSGRDCCCRSSPRMVADKLVFLANVVQGVCIIDIDNVDHRYLVTHGMEGFVIKPSTLWRIPKRTKTRSSPACPSKIEFQSSRRK
ncbi:hypothetical protein F5Y15DRAFT_242044 [Xylariaceae sp. FL0016]|nr:hypothetical protein F5Y15DRAFT_242044 [Xylariaceae sp. FL0016]